uniref:Uncharacterized protein n=1 Tax=Tanacetum cinerariifolium TaxID=118510 RepID=A0A6L2KC15_TANCI|nr:hypothetical protein [Tanacetum cinerariifolium]
MTGSVKKVEARENINLVKEFVLAEEVKQLVEGEKEGDENGSYDTFLLNQEDLGNSLAFGSHKESLESPESCRQNIFCKRDHDVHLDDDVLLEEETSAKKRKKSRGSYIL